MQIDVVRRRIALRLALALAVAATTLALSAAPSLATTGCGVVNHDICVSNTALSNPVVTNGFGKNAFVLDNRGGNTVNNLVVKITGAQVVSTSAGTISADKSTVTLTDAQAKPGYSKSWTISYKTQSTTGPQTICAEVVWNEGAKNGGRTDKATSCEVTQVRADAPQSYLPTLAEGQSVGVTKIKLLTDQTKAQSLTTTIPLLSGFSGKATSGYAAAPDGYSCVLGTLTFQDTVYACRNAPDGFFSLNITDANGNPVNSATNPYGNTPATALNLVLKEPSGLADSSFPTAVFYANNTGGLAGIAKDACGTTVPSYPNGCLTQPTTISGGYTTFYTAWRFNGRRY